jgi:ribonuclease BN (tRNA processing enzyme)
LLAESSFVEGGRHNPMDMHLTGRQAALTAERAGVGQLVLTHIPPWHDREVVRSEAVPHFAGPVSLAVTGASYDL